MMETHETNIEDFDRQRVTELVGYYPDPEDDKFSNIIYLMKDGRYVQILRRQMDDTALLHFIKGLSAEEVLVMSLTEESWSWIHSPRNSALAINPKLKTVEFHSVG